MILQIKWQQTRQEALEVMEWVSGKGEATGAVKDAILRTRMTFGIALITRGKSDGFNRN